MKFMCECFCESESELLECGESGGWDRIRGVIVELMQLYGFPIVIGQVEESFWPWEAHTALPHKVRLLLV